MKNIAIIPARGGSKGLKRKNVALLDGKPLIWYTIIACSESNCFDRIICSTDDQEIASIAREFGAETPFLRPESLAGDTSSLQDAVAYTLRTLEESEGYVGDMYSVLYPTYPFRTLDLVREVAFQTEHFAANSISAIPTIVNSDKYVTVSADGRAVSLSKNDSGMTVYRGIGSIFSSRVLPAGKMIWESLKEYYIYLNMKTLFEKNFRYKSFNHYVPIKNEYEALDINCIEDLVRAEEIIRDGLFRFDWERKEKHAESLVKA